MKLGPTLNDGGLVSNQRSSSKTNNRRQEIKKNIALDISNIRRNPNRKYLIKIYFFVPTSPSLTTYQIASLDWDKLEIR